MGDEGTVDEEAFFLDEVGRKRLWRELDASDFLFILAFITTSLASFYAFSLASIDLGHLITTAFSMTLGVEEILSLILRLIPFSFLFPLPFSIIAFYGIGRRRFNRDVPLLSSLVSALSGLLFFAPSLTYLIFSVSFIAGSITCGYWSHIRYMELKSMRVYRASTRSASRGFSMIRIGIIAAVLISLVSDEVWVEGIMESSVDSYAILSMKMSEKQLRPQVESSVRAQMDVQEEMLTNLTIEVANVFKFRGIKRIAAVGERGIQLIEGTDLTDKRKNEINRGLGELIVEERHNWVDDVDAQTVRITSGISDRFRNETYQEQLIDEYEQGLREEMLNEGTVKEQLKALLSEPVDIGGREVVVYDFIKKILPMLVVLLLWGFIGIWMKFVFLPLTGFYSTILARMFKDEARVGKTG